MRPPSIATGAGGRASSTTLLTPDLVATFVREFQQEFNHQQTEQSQHRHQLQAEIDKVECQIAAIVAAVKDGLYHAAMKDELTRLEERRIALTQELSAQPAPVPAIPPQSRRALPPQGREAARIVE